MKRSVILLVLAVLAGEVLAAPAAVVRLLQAPAWRERGSEREPLQPGQELASGNVIHTGPGARALLVLEEGSVVKLGAEADLALRELVPPASADGVFSGVLDVLKGAFRFTTTIASRKRDIRAQLRSATIGIRGTNVWGKVEEARDFVVLLEGQVAIERDGQSYVLETPMSLFMAPRGAPPDAIGPVNADELAVWAQETEAQPDSGVVDGEGRYRLNLASLPSAAAASDLAGRLATAGYASLVEAVEVDGRAWWRVVSSGYVSRADALAVAAALREPFALTSPWVGSVP